MSKNIDRRKTLAFLVTGATCVAVAVPIFADHGGTHQAPGPNVRQASAHGGAPRPEARFDPIRLRNDEFVLGAQDAPVTLIKYGSLTCPHCASFHINTAAVLKAEHIPAGRVRYVHRHFPLDQAALAAAILLHCRNDNSERFFGLVDILYREQAKWARAHDPITALTRIAAASGLDTEEYRHCLNDSAMIERVMSDRNEGSEVFGVRATPTLLINDQRYSGNLGIAQVNAILDGLA